MKVRHTTWISVDNGTPREIVRHLDESSLPPDAKVVSAEAERFSITIDDDVCVTPMRMKFAWETDE